MVLESFRDGYQVVMKIAEDEGRPQQLLVAHAGIVLLCGIDSAGAHGSIYPG